jgi:hypothetical protein
LKEKKMPKYTPRGKREKEKTRQQKKRSSQYEEASATNTEEGASSAEEPTNPMDVDGPSTPAKETNKRGRPPKRRPSGPLTPLTTRPPQFFPSTSTAEPEPMDTANNASTSVVNTSDSEYSNNEMCVGGEEEQQQIEELEHRSHEGTLKEEFLVLVYNL